MIANPFQMFHETPAASHHAQPAKAAAEVRANISRHLDPSAINQSADAPICEKVRFQNRKHHKRTVGGMKTADWAQNPTPVLEKVRFRNKKHPDRTADNPIETAHRIQNTQSQRLPTGTQNTITRKTNRVSLQHRNKKERGHTDHAPQKNS